MNRSQAAVAAARVHAPVREHFDTQYCVPEAARDHQVDETEEVELQLPKAIAQRIAVLDGKQRVKGRHWWQLGRAQLWNGLCSFFLPEGWPDSVTPDYLPFQVRR